MAGSVGGSLLPPCFVADTDPMTGTAKAGLTSSWDQWWHLGTQHELRLRLTTWDPIGIGAEDVPPDEYDCMVAPLLGMLVEGAEDAVIAKWLTDELSDHFGLDPEDRRDASFADELIRWWLVRAHRDGDRRSAGALLALPAGLTDLRTALLRLVIGDQPTEHLPGLAAQVLATGEVDSPSLQELAGLNSTAVREALELFCAALEELGVKAPTENEARREIARAWAISMLAGLASPYEASRNVWVVWVPRGCPEEFTAFVGLASEWEDDPENRAQYDKDMVAEAGRLIGTHSRP